MVKPTQPWPKKVGNGCLPLKLKNGKFYTVWGGRSLDRPENMRFLKLAKELPLPCDIDMPVVDFQVPTKAQVDVALSAAIDCILAGKPLYVGCMGGQGRTGLMLALIAKAFSVKSPVPYVRRKYYSHAVETDMQYKFVTKYRVPKSIKRKIKAATLLSYLRFGQNLTKSLSQEESKVWMFIVDKLAPHLA